MSEELHKVRRPTVFKQVFGQEQAVQTLQQKLASKTVPHAILFHGPSGTGKTTLARILSSKLGCAGVDLKEVNCADVRGIDSVREIRRKMNLAPMGGQCRVWIVDEAHKLSNDAQNAFLKILEEPPAKVYFLLATTDPDKLIKTIRTRCTPIQCNLLKPKVMKELIVQLVDMEGLKVTEDVVDKIVHYAEGSARQGVVLLDLIKDEEDEEKQLKMLEASEHKQKGIEIARALINPRATWKEVAILLKSVENSDEPEQLRWMILGYASSVLLGGKQLSSRADLIIDMFRDNFYDCKRAGLISACYKVVTAK